MTKWDYSVVNDKDRLAEFIGENKKDKYLIKFGMRVYDDTCKNLPQHPKLSWNWSAFFVGVLWLGYRKMYFELIIISILLQLPSLIFPNISPELDAIITFLYWFSFGLFSNSLYFYNCKRKITRVKKLNLSMYNELEALNQMGGASVVGIFISFLTLVINVAIFVMARLYLY